MGVLSILNVGEGDTKITFNPKDQASMATASSVIADLLARGFAILIQVGTDDEDDPIYKRAKGFDPKTFEYIVAGVIDDRADEKPPTAPSGSHKAKEKRNQTGRVSAIGTQATAVARTAGG